MTIYQLVNYFKVLQAQEPRLKSFIFGTLADFQSAKDLAFPCLWLELPVSVESQNFLNETFTLSFNILDRHAKFMQDPPVEQPNANIPSDNLTTVYDTVAGLSVTEIIAADILTMLLKAGQQPGVPILQSDYQLNSFTHSYNSDLLGWRINAMLVAPVNRCEVNPDYVQIANIFTSTPPLPPEPPQTFCELAPAGYTFGGFKISITNNGGTFTLTSSSQGDPGGPYPYTDLDSLASSLFGNSLIYSYQVDGDILTVYFNSLILIYLSTICADTIKVWSTGSVSYQVIEEMNCCEASKTFCENLRPVSNFGGFILEVNDNGGTFDVAHSTETPPVGPPYAYTNIFDLVNGRFYDTNVYNVFVGDNFSQNANKVIIEYNATILDTLPAICAGSWLFYDDGTSSGNFEANQSCCA